MASFCVSAPRCVRLIPIWARGPWSTSLVVRYLHLQGLIYPLTVASKSLLVPRKSAALRLLDEVRKVNDVLVEQVMKCMTCAAL